MEEKDQMRGVYCALVLIVAILFAYGIKSHPEPAEESNGVWVYSEESFRTEIVDENLIDFVDDEDYGEYAISKLAEHGIQVVTGITGTVYNAVEEQCSGNPLVTADGSKIDKGKLESGEIRWIAVSRDLLKVFNYGDKVEISGAGKYNGIWEIHDTMSPKLMNHIDFLVPDTITAGRWKNTITIMSIRD